MMLSLPTFIGERVSGQDIRSQNVRACVTLANMMKTSLGPDGLDKMLVDHIGEVTISNDGATILKLLQVEHPAARLLVDLAQLQDDEVGDGTTSVVILAAELLKHADNLVKKKNHPTNVISGYLLAMNEACDYIARGLAIDSTSLGSDVLLNAAKTTMASKILAVDAAFFADLAVRAVQRIRVPAKKAGAFKYPITRINILKSPGKSALESALINGYAMNCVMVSPQMPRTISNAKIALLDFNLGKSKLPLGVTIKLSDTRELEAIRDREVAMAGEMVALLVEAGANVIFTTKGIDDLAAKHMVAAGVMGVRRCKKSDLKRIAKATGGKLIISLADLEGGQSFSPANLGEAASVVQEFVSDQELIVIRGTQGHGASLILRGPNQSTLEEMERSLHDAFSAVKNVLEMNAVVPGGAAVEVALSMYLENFARMLGSREQLAVAEFAHALLVIPKTLAINANYDAIELTSQLCTLHKAAQDHEDKKHFARYGLDLDEGKTADNLQRGVLESAQVKIKCIRFATEAAMSILRIDDMIKLNKKPDPKSPHDECE